MSEQAQEAIERLIEGNRWRLEHKSPFGRDVDPGPERSDLERVVAFLREAYTGDPVPPCSVCGVELEPASMGGGDATRYACPDANTLGTRWGTPEGDKARDHYQRSQFTHRHPGDSNALAMLDIIAALSPAPTGPAQPEQEGT